MRAPLAASAVSNLLLGIGLSWRSGAPTSVEAGAIALLSLATCCLYWAGMVLNDVFDVERDRELYPQRALPSGRVPFGLAAGLGAGLVLGGLALAGGAAALATGSPARGLIGASAVALCVLGYDGGLKRLRLIGSIAMGSCRFTNALLGAYALGLWSPSQELDPTLLHAILLGVFVTFLTWLSTYEDERAGTAAISFGYLGLLAAPVTLIVVPLLGEGWRPLGLLGGVALFAVVLTQLISTILEGTRARGQATTRALLQAIWLVDLGSLLARGPLPLLGAWALLFVLGKAGAKLLFRPPPRPAEGASATGDETSAASPGTMEGEASGEDDAGAP